MNLSSAIKAVYPEVLRNIQANWAPYSGRKAEETAHALLSLNRARYQAKIIENYTGGIKNKKILEIGSGYSIFLIVARNEFSAKAFGIEPAKDGIYSNILKIARFLFLKSGLSTSYVKKGRGESIPFKDNYFDIVCSHYVLEHANNHEKIIRESIRVLKRDGYLVFIIPNYGSFWEGHYGIIWLPFLNKFFAKIYLKILGKNTKIIDEINFTNQWELESIVKNIPNIKVVSWGQDLFKKSLNELNFPAEGTLSSTKKILNILNKFKLGNLIGPIAGILKFQTPIVLVIKKI